MSETPENQEIDQVEIPRSGLYYVIPASIMDLPNDIIKPLEKLLYVLLSGLAHSSGECFPGDEYLADRLGKVSRKHVSEMIGNLERLGLITRRTESHPNNPFRRRRIITVVDPFKKSLPSNPQVTLDRHPQVTPQRHPQVTIVSKEIVSEEKSDKERTLTRSKEKPQAPPPMVFENVEIENHLYENLIKDLGVETVGRYISKLNNYSQNRPDAFRKYKRHDLVIRDWVERDGGQKSSGGSESEEQKRRSTSEKIENMLGKDRKFPGSISSFHDRIEIWKGGQSEAIEIKYKDPSFWEVLKNEFRKMNLSLSDFLIS